MSGEFKQEIEQHIKQFLDKNVSKELVEPLMAKMRKGATKYGDKAFQACRENAVNADMMKHANEELMDFILYMGFLDWQIKEKVINSIIVPIFSETVNVFQKITNHSYEDGRVLCPYHLCFDEIEDDDKRLVKDGDKLLIYNSKPYNYVFVKDGIYEPFMCKKCGRYEFFKHETGTCCNCDKPIAEF